MKRQNGHPTVRIIRKELFRFLTDKKILVSILLPGVLIFALYSLMGDALSSGFGEETASELTVAAVGETAVLDALAEAHAASGGSPILTVVSAEQSDAALRELLSEGEIDLIAYVPSGFSSVAGPAVGEAPEIRLYFDSARGASGEAYALVLALLDAYESSLSNCFDVNQTVDRYDLADASELSATVYSMMMPMLLVMLLFSGCMSAAPESIAGEKERGTIATLLITPMKRSHLAVGKVVGCSVTALLSGLSSFIGVMLSLPRLMGEELAEGASYGVTDYLLILAVMLSTVLLFVSLISVLSALASSVKEASTMLLPVMILVMGVGVSGMFAGSLPSTPAFFLIPIYGSVEALSSVFSYSVEPISILLTVLSNLASALLLTLLLTRMFSSERVMFRR